MNLKEEMRYDLNFNRPKVIADENMTIIENVSSIVMISETSLTVSAGKKFVTVRGKNFVIKEIFEGRLLIEGAIQGIEFLCRSSGDKD